MFVTPIKRAMLVATENSICERETRNLILADFPDLKSYFYAITKFQL